MQDNFPDKERFSLEGLEGVIPALQAVIEQSAKNGVEHFVIGSENRGRTTILENILDFSP